MICAESQVEESAVMIRQKATVLPWHDGPRHLVSWWDMNRFDAGKYLNIAANLGAMSAEFARHPEVPLSQSNLVNLRRQLSERA